MGLRISAKPSARGEKSWLFDSPAQLQAWGGRLAKRLKQGDVLALVGPLGAGKTTFVQAVARARGYQGAVTSPTFALANEYQTPRGPVYHMDMYRLSVRERTAFPLEDYWGGAGRAPCGLCLIEWADRVRDRWPADVLEIEFQINSPESRRVSLKSSRAWEKRLASLMSAHRAR